MPIQKAVHVVDLYLISMLNYLKRYRKFYRDFYLRDLQILLFIDRDNEDHQVTVSQLAEHLKVTPAAASQLVSNYEKKNWVERIHSDKDRRTVYVRVSDLVLERFNQDVEYIKKVLAEELSNVPDEDIIGFTKVLNIISNNLQTDVVFFHRSDKEDK